MAIVTGAVLAVGAAISAASFASVATAVVAVSAVIGVAGLAVTAVGAITKNPDLLKAGKIMGYVGLAGGLAGGVIGGVGGLASGAGFMEGAMGAYQGAAQYMSEGWDKGVGSWFASDPTGGAATSAAPTVTNAHSGPYSGEVGAAPYYDDAVQSVSQNLPPPDAGVLSTPAADHPLHYTSALGNADAGRTATTLGQNGPIPGSVPTADVSLAQQTAAANLGPLAPGPPTVLGPSTAANQFATPGVLNTANTAGLSPNVANAIGNMPDWMKYAAMTSGIQGLSGLASGYFQGLSAEEQLELQKWVEQNKQNQLNITNTRSAYSPLVSFNRGAFNTGRA